MEISLAEAALLFFVEVIKSRICWCEMGFNCHGSSYASFFSENCVFYVFLVFPVDQAMSINQIGDDGRGATCGKLKCSETVINCGRLVPLVDAFSPLATSFEAPILAGETLYPSVEHHVAAQLLR